MSQDYPFSAKCVKKERDMHGITETVIRLKEGEFCAKRGGTGGDGGVVGIVTESYQCKGWDGIKKQEGTKDIKRDGICDDPCGI
jgi:hypothetical protein